MEELVDIDFYVGENNLNLLFHLVESLMLVAFMYVRHNWAVLLSLALSWSGETNFKQQNQTLIIFTELSGLSASIKELLKIHRTHFQMTIQFLKMNGWKNCVTVCAVNKQISKILFQAILIKWKLT